MSVWISLGVVMYTHSTVSRKVCIPFPVLQVTTTVPAKGAHTTAVSQL